MEEAMKRLRHELLKARLVCATCDKAPDAVMWHRACARRAVIAVVKFLKDSGVPREDLGLLIDISGAFRDHKHGKPNPLFGWVKKRGGGTLSRVGGWRASVAATVALLVNAGEKKKTALAHVADSLTKAGLTGVTAKRVDSWHREISSERFGDPDVIQLFKNLVAAGAKEHPTDTRRAAEKLLAVVTKDRPMNCN